ncbi:MAG: exosortase B [Burkholderiales bacterium]|nr:exosortase B [Burkholderiales bacterium]MCH2240798.1 exosortase B [Aquabacterium sp.]
MTATVPARAGLAGAWSPYLPILLGLGALYVPVFVELWNGLWQTEEQGHAPLILAAAAWVFYTLQDRAAQARSKPSRISGGLTLAAGLVLYALGRVLDIVLLELGSLPVVVSATLAFLYGWRTVWVFRFPLLFVLFALPLPGFIVDALTAPLKLWVSVLAETTLYAAGYPIARSGVSLTLGQYQMLVADACSGLNSMFSLMATGIFYVYLAGRKNKLQNALLVAAIPVVAFFANVIRVIIICLVTYYFGDEAGQGFVHGAAGMVLFAVSLVLLFALDLILDWLFRHRRSSTLPMGANPR